MSETVKEILEVMRFYDERAQDWADRIEAAMGGGIDLGHTLGKLDQSAPARIWLQVDTSESNDVRDCEWPDDMGVSWCSETTHGLEVMYVRADLVVTAQQAKGE